MEHLTEPNEHDSLKSFSEPESPFDMNRHNFIKLAATFGLVVWADGWGMITKPQTALADVVLPLFDEQINPEKTGILPPQDMHDIWSIFNYIGQAWQNGEFCNIKTEQDLKPIIDLKTSQVPSYLTEYQEAIAFFRDLKSKYGEQEALRKLFFEESLPRIRQYVLSEFLYLQISQGGFLKFGYKNYLGYMAAPFDDPAHLPYRGVEYSC